MNGKQYETAAAIYLKFHGYTVVDRNYHSRFGEIDIIARKKETLVFVEVKARGRNAICEPAYAVDVYKQKKILKTAQFYILHKSKEDCDIRFDVIEITKGRLFLKFNHITDAFGV
ncbi:MAG: YraN family protein [Clostridia bacterium]|nr:YraN family protein [Clostridia bacterium]